nr:MAG TPA: hypothetical protein [Caudoviricetes sp.]
MYNGGIPKKYTFRFGNISFRFTIVEHFVLRIILVIAGFADVFLTYLF